MNDKYLLILNTLINEFIKVKDPIGSEQLKKVISMDMSSATIRYYFKKMVDDGIVEQLHRSGGRIPTDTTMIEYWSTFFESIGEGFVIDTGKVERSAKEFDIYVCMKDVSSNVLEEVRNIEDKYLLIIFTESEIAVRYNRLLEKFLRDFLGNEIEKIASVIKQIGLEPFATKINEAISSNIKIYNRNRLFDFELQEDFQSLYDGTVINQDFRIGFDYPLLKTKLQVQNEEGRKYQLFLLGELTNDYKNFIRSISGN